MLRFSPTGIHGEGLRSAKMKIALLFMPQFSPADLHGEGRRVSSGAVRHIRRSLQAAGLGFGIGNGGWNSGYRDEQIGSDGSPLARGAECFRSSDQGRGHTKGTSQNGGNDLQRIWPLKHGLQRDCVLGSYRFGIALYSCVGARTRSVVVVDEHGRMQRK